MVLVTGRRMLVVLLDMAQTNFFVFALVLIGLGGSAIVVARLVGVTGNQRHHGIERLSRLGLS